MNKIGSRIDTEEIEKEIEASGTAHALKVDLVYPDQWFSKSVCGLLPLIIQAEKHHNF
mgnify:CR=1 FL=1